MDQTKEGVMPKERIYNAISGPYEVQIGWHADSDVQLGVELHDAREEHPDFQPLPDRRSLLWQLFGDRENLRRFGFQLTHLIGGIERVIDVVHDPATSDEDGHEVCVQLAIEVLMTLQDGWQPTGVWATLTREDCNRAIRTLRRARDSAFGRDE